VWPAFAALLRQGSSEGLTTIRIISVSRRTWIELNDIVPAAGGALDVINISCI
jgi:hypothetical protein